MGRAVDSYVDLTRRAGALPYYADALIDMGELDRAQELMIEARAEYDRAGGSARAYETTWSLARIAAARGDAQATLRLLRQAEDQGREFEWFGTHQGLWFLLEAAEMLDRVALSDQAREYFERGREIGGDRDEEVMQARAVLLARSGDPVAAIERLQALARGDWLEKRLVWRHTLLTAWATFRVGREGAGELAARALTQARDCGTVMIAVAGEPDLVTALAPEAERSGSALARDLLLGGQQRAVVIRLFGPTSIRRAAGEELELPTGLPGELVRLLALNQAGLPVHRLLNMFFPDVDEPTARKRLRQVLVRVRASMGELVIREGERGDGERLTLVPAWVDVNEFTNAAARAKQARGARAVLLAYAALGQCAPGSLLPEHPYAQWAQEARENVEHLQLELLELIAADATRRESHQEALTALEAAIKLSPEDPDLHRAIRAQLEALGRHRAAEYLK